MSHLRLLVYNQKPKELTLKEKYNELLLEHSRVQAMLDYVMTEYANIAEENDKLKGIDHDINKF